MPSLDCHENAPAQIEPTIVLPKIPKYARVLDRRIAAAQKELGFAISRCIERGIDSPFLISAKFFSGFDPKLHGRWGSELAILQQRTQNFLILNEHLTPNECPPGWFEKLQRAASETDVAKQTALVVSMCHEAFDGPGPDIGNELFKPLSAESREALRKAANLLDQMLAGKGA